MLEVKWSFLCDDERKNVQQRRWRYIWFLFDNISILFRLRPLCLYLHSLWSIKGRGDGGPAHKWAGVSFGVQRSTRTASSTSTSATTTTTNTTTTTTTNEAGLALECKDHLLGEQLRQHQHQPLCHLEIEGGPHWNWAALCATWCCCDILEMVDFYFNLEYLLTKIQQFNN